MRTRKLILPSLVLMLIAMGSGRDLQAKEKTSLRFSNTGSYDSVAKRQLATSPVILLDWQEIIQISPPPGNASAEVRNELAELHRMEKERSPATIALIKAEQTMEGFEFGDRLYTQLAQQAPAMKRLLDLAIGEASPIIFALKKEHDRVRPSALDPTLNPCIEIPGHPSYPSGHATQAYLFAYLFAAVDPAHTADYFQRASEIAIRREEAGVHFSSDTEAGRELARQLHRALQDKPPYQEHLKAARLEFYDGELPEEFQPARDPYEILAEQREAKARQEAARNRPTQPTPKKSPGLLKGLFNRFQGD